MALPFKRDVKRVTPGLSDFRHSRRKNEVGLRTESARASCAVVIGGATTGQQKTGRFERHSGLIHSLRAVANQSSIAFRLVRPSTPCRSASTPLPTNSGA
jgi:hypothetical protein